MSDPSTTTTPTPTAPAAPITTKPMNTANDPQPPPPVPRGGGNSSGGRGRCGRSGGGGGRGRGSRNNNYHHDKASKSGNTNTTTNTDDSNNSNKQMVDSLREACPAHKQNELLGLVESLQYDEEKIRQKISEWWDEPIVPSSNDGDWEDVNKRSSSSHTHNHTNSHINTKFQKAGGRGRGGFNSSSSTDNGGGRGRGNTRGGREGRGRDGRGRGRNNDRGPNKGIRPSPTAPTIEDDGAAAATITNPASTTIPVDEPTTPHVRPPQGAWAKKSIAESEPMVVDRDLVVPPPPPQQPHVVAVETKPVDIASPALSTATVSTPSAVPPRTGNVWATRGSAHLIKAEKPVPPKPIIPPVPVVPRSAVNGGTSRNDKHTIPSNLTLQGMQSTPTTSTNDMVTSSVPINQEPAVVVVAPPTLSVVPPTSVAPAINAWNKDASDPVVVTPILPVPTNNNMLESKQSLKPTNVLNLGRWETGDTDDNLDFGFGSFGTDHVDVDGNVDAHAESTAVTAATNVTASPARPPPGLSISGMPPMPANAVLVHELENKLEEVSVSKQQHQQPQPTMQDSATSSSIPGLTPSSQQPPYNTPHHTMHETNLLSPPIYGNSHYNSASGMGMYNSYGSGVGGNIPGHAFVGMPGSGGLTGPPPPPPVHKVPMQQQHLYNSAPSSGNATGLVAATNSSGVGSNDSSTPATSTLPSTTNNAGTAASTMPPGMTPGGMPYGNPMYFNQQQFVMGQHQPGLGYNYGYGSQFAGGVQGGFGYPGGMHGTAGYGHGGPSYEDHSGVVGNTGGLPGSGGVGGYDQQQPKNTGGYRGGGGGGRHNNNQYQSYNPQQQHHQHAGYGAQPYGMGYHDNHFNQRGGYQGMQDPYGMQQQQQPGVGGYGGGGFQNDNQYKGKKNNRSGGLNQFQQQGPPMGNQNQHLSGQQTFGLQGQGGVGNDTNQPSADGWSNQGGAWSAGATGWHGK